MCLSLIHISTSWADLWDEQYAGNILMFNNSRDAYAIAAFKSGHSINPATDVYKRQPVVWSTSRRSCCWTSRWVHWT